MVKTKTEIYSRVVGYMRPVDNWNDSKKAEFKDRVTYQVFNKSEEQQTFLK